MTKQTPRHLDHVVLPVPDLEIARARYSALGFTVAPDARHKFGTENACIFFENGTFIEPLAIGQRETVEAAIKKRNQFLRRDAAFRFRNGEDGFTMIVFGEPDPKKSRKALQKAGYETGKLVTVRRPGVKVRIALAIDERSADFTMFHCERPDGPPAFPAELNAHENGATGISAVYVHEHLPEDFQYYFQTVTGQREVRSHSFGMEMKLPNASLKILNTQGARTYLGTENVSTSRGLRAIGFDIQVKSVADTQKLLETNGVSLRHIGNSILVDPAMGQGAIIRFTEK